MPCATDTNEPSSELDVWSELLLRDLLEWLVFVGARMLFGLDGDVQDV